EIDNNSEEEFSNLILNNNKTKLQERVENFWDDEERRSKEGYTHLSDMLDAIKKRPRFYGNTRLQLTFKDKIVHEDDEVKYGTNNTKVITTLRVAEGWAYINYEKSFHPTVTSFLKKKLDLSNAPGSDQLRRLSIGNTSYDNLPRRRSNNRV
ncbi:16170_t:CDS:2, partial [Funneliformis geosporum]